MSNWYFRFSVLQFNHFSTSWSRCQILFRIYTNTVIHNDDRCVGVWPESFACFEGTRWSVGPPCSSSWYHRLVFFEWYWISTWRLTWFISRERRIEGNFVKTISFEFPLVKILILISLLTRVLMRFYSVFTGGNPKARCNYRIHENRKHGNEQSAY